MSEFRIDSEQKLVFLTGAPTSNSLRWEEVVLSAPLQDCFLDTPKTPKSILSFVTSPEPVWRSLPLHREYLPTGFTQPSRADNRIPESNYRLDEDFFPLSAECSHNLFNEASSQVSVTANLNEEELSQYYEHSFAVHEDASFAHSIDPESDSNLSTSFEECSISIETSATPTPKIQLTKLRLTSSVLTNLDQLPNASYLRSITPQTMTVNLVAGIISIPPPRMIMTRQGRQVELIEMLVGDDTAAGFGINIWLPSDQNANRKSPQTQDFQSEVSQLRPRDVVLARNIALSSYGGKVYGQSLRKDLTTMNLLYRNLVDVTDQQGAFSAQDLNRESVDDLQVSKVSKVRQWVMDFVGVGIHSRLDQKVEKFRGKERRLQELPPDTP